MDEDEIRFWVAALTISAFIVVLLVIAFAVGGSQPPPFSVPPWPDIDGTLTTVRG